ncbi:DGQHR domain-containing protein [Lunatimonas lonarensis]|nr:DGQHR domain-containing protein [Lunatimonas lonarensis]
MTRQIENGFEARKITQINQEFLLGIFTYSQFKKWSKPTERLIVGYEEELVDQDEFFKDKPLIKPVYNSQIQRKTNNSKVENIADFLIRDNYSMFPTNIIVAVPAIVIDKIEEISNDSVSISLNEIVFQEIEKENGDVFLTIIDGQHRIKGIERAIQKLQDIIGLELDPLERKKYSDKLNKILELELVVSFFLDPPLEYQAMIFSTINKTQTKVPENLVYSLFGLTNLDSPQKTALEVVLALNGIEKSPFFGRVKLVGNSYKRGELIPLSQATMVKSILFLICRGQKEAELERWKKRTEMRDENQRLIFRDFYRTNEDKNITRVIFLYFSAVREVFLNEDGQSYWDLGSTDKINLLQTNVSYQAFMRLLVDIFISGHREEIFKKEFYLALLKKITVDFQDPENKYPFTSKTIKLLYEDMKSQIFID